MRNLNIIAYLVLLVFPLGGCSQTTSEVNLESNVPIRLAPVSRSPEPVEPKPTIEVEPVLKKWSDQVGENYFYWDGEDLTIKLRTDKEIKVFSEYAMSGYRFQTEKNDAASCLVSFYYRPVAIAGDLISFIAESGLSCGATNTYGWGYVTAELADNDNVYFHKPNAKDDNHADQADELEDIVLSDLFSDAEIFTGLMENERISKDIYRLMDEGRVDRKPTSLAELKTLLKRFEYNVLDSMFYFGSNSLESFAIHHVENDKVSVWLSLTPNSRAGQATREHLEIFLPIPQRLKGYLIKADSLDEGFLMRDASQIVGTEPAIFRFGRQNR